MSSRRKQHHEEEEHENHERWLVTYADMLTVLMALFIVMFAISVVDQTKAEKLAGSVREYFGTGPTLIEGGDGLLEDQKPGDTEEQLIVDIQAAVAALEEKRAREQAGESAQDELASVRERVEQSLAGRGMPDAASFHIDERGLVVAIVTDDVLFDLGSAALRPEGSAVLDAVVPALLTMPNAVTVEGHTDDLPLRAGHRFATNWELSAARATAVLRYMAEKHGLPADRLSAVGYADQRPLVENTAAQRGTNRRVEVIVRRVLAAVPNGEQGAAVSGQPDQPSSATSSAEGSTGEQDAHDQVG